MAVRDILRISFEFSPKLGIRKLPKLTAKKESNVPGLFIVGDLADAPIIKVALNQGHQVAEKVLEELGDLSKAGTKDGRPVLDVVVVGAGPAGIGAALALGDAGATYVVLERERPFNTIQNFPKNKLIFSEPRELENRGNFWFEDAQKENLLNRWDDALEARMLRVQQPEEVTNIQRESGLFTITTKVADAGLMGEPHIDGVSAEAGAKNTYLAKRVILAIGRRGAVRRLNAPGEDLDKVAYTLKDPADHAGRDVLIFGGGDSAVEAAVACAEAGANVTVSYRQDSFHRAKLKNQERIQALINAGTLRAEFGTKPVEVREDVVVLKRGDDTIDVPNQDVLVFFGTKLPSGFLKRVGIRMDGEMDFRRAAWVISFALITYLIYVIKKEKTLWPFGEGQPFEAIPAMFQLDLGFRATSGGFWGTVLYSALILVFGIIAYRKYPLKQQKRRYIWLITFQLLFLFGLPEIIAPLFYESGWKLYAISVPWPLWKESILVGNPQWSGGATDMGWTFAALGVSFVLMPLFVRYQGERFCSYLCGCGGLAETLGDRWRHLAPRGKQAKQMEWFGRLILLITIPVTIVVAMDFWQLTLASSAQEFSKHWYDLIVEFWLASVLGVAFYPYLGNRFWCRFFCPLRAFMELMSKLWGKIAIKPNDKCIGCGECTRYCQMGINVQKFAQRQLGFHNGNSACIQCGMCVQVCPMEVLSVGERDFKLKTKLVEW